MSEETPGDAEGLGPAAVLVILVLGAMLSFLVWTNLRRNWQLEVERQSQSFASTLAHAVESEVQQIDALLRRRAQMWMSDVFTRDAHAWREDAAMLIADNPSLLAILRADPSWEIAGGDPGKEILREVFPEARRIEADADSEWIVGPLLVQGRNVFGLQVRASREGADTRTVFAVLAADRLLPDLLDGETLSLHGKLLGPTGRSLPKPHARTG